MISSLHIWSSQCSHLPSGRLLLLWNMVSSSSYHLPLSEFGQVTWIWAFILRRAPLILKTETTSSRSSMNSRLTVRHAEERSSMVRRNMEWVSWFSSEVKQLTFEVLDCSFLVNSPITLSSAATQNSTSTERCCAQVQLSLAKLVPADSR